MRRGGGGAALLAAGFVLAVPSSCARAPARAPSAANRAAATIAPVASLVASVAGPAWEVLTIVPPGTSAHVFEPRPSDVAALAGARLVVTVGAGYDSWVARMAAAGAAGAVVHDTCSSLGIGRGPGSAHAAEEEGAGHAGEAGRAGADLHDNDNDNDKHGARGGGHGGEAHGADDGHGHGDVATDPHWWLSPLLAARSLGPIAERLALLDPGGAEGYRRRAAEMAERIGELDRRLAGELSPVRGASFVATHAGWTHFADRYGLVAAASVEPAPGRDPSPRQLRELIDIARAGGAGVLFTEPQFPERAARIVARDGGLEVVLVDPIGGVAGRSGYLETMEFNGSRFAASLKAPRQGRS